MKPSKYTVAQRIKRGWSATKARNTPTLKPGRQMKQGLRAVVSKRHRTLPAGGKAVFYEATIRGPKQRIYLRAYDTREAADEACRIYIETGEKPEPGKRGVKPGTAMQPRKTRQTQYHGQPRAEAPRNSRSPDRMEMMRKLYREKFAC